MLFIIINHNLINKKYLEPLKVKLKYTVRIKRLIVTTTILLFVINFLIIYYSSTINYLIILFPLSYFFQGGILIISNIINYPIEKLIQLKYILKAKNKLKKFSNLIVVAITGSYGKTSTKNYLYQILSKKYNVLITPNSYNTPMGITKTINEKLNISHQIFIVEMGADHNNDIKKLCKIISPNIAIITAVGKQHLETFKTIDNIINTKYQIVQYSKQNSVFVTNTDNEICKLYYSVTQKEKYSVGKNKTCDIQIENVDINNSSVITTKIFGKQETFKTNILGEYNISNIMLAVMVAIKLNVSMFDIKTAVKSLEQVEHRLKLVKLKNGATLIDDSFNSNPQGCLQSLNVLNTFNKNKIVLTCGMVGLKNEQFEENFKFGRNIAKVANLVLIINNVNYKAIYNGLINANFDISKIKYFSSFSLAYKYILEITNESDVILIENDLTDSYILES